VSLPRIAAAIAALVAAGGAVAFVRTADRTTGRPLAWPVRTVPWNLNRDWPGSAPTCLADAAGDPGLAAVRASFAAWEQSCTDLRLLFAGTLADTRTGFGGTAENLVVVREGWCSRHPDARFHPCMTDPDVDCGGLFNCFEDSACDPAASTCTVWNTVALTSVLYDPETGRILNADIEMNGWDGQGAGQPLPTSQPPRGWYFTCGEIQTPCDAYGDGACRFMDLRNTLTHEVGHFVGLGHVPQAPPATPLEERATMEPTTTSGDIWMRTLSEDDAAGVCAIYPDEGDGGCGCGSGGAAGALALFLAALALRRPSRGRRRA
jgi:hypothetical protein